MSTAAAGSRTPRGLAPVALAVVLGAAAMAGAGLLTWGTADFQDSLTGPFTRTVTGADVLPELTPISLAVLAGLAAVAATRGLPRRIIGAGIALAGVLVAVRSLGTAFGPAPAQLQDLSRPAASIGPAEGATWPPLLAALGAVLVIAGGLLVVIGRTSGGGLGSRYDRAPRTPRPGDAAAGADSAGLDLWKSLDADQDPTASDEGPHGSEGR